MIRIPILRQCLSSGSPPMACTLFVRQTAGGNMDPNDQGCNLMDWVDIIGTIAGVLTTFSAAPQLVTTYRTRNVRDLDLRFLLMLDAGLFLWALYGIAIMSLPIIVFNSIGCLLWLPIIWMKIANR